MEFVRLMLFFNSALKLTVPKGLYYRVDLCKNNNEISKLNNNSLSNEKLNIINEDAYLFVKENTEEYDIIIIDLPDTNNESLNKLYTNVFYNYVKASVKNNIKFI